MDTGQHGSLQHAKEKRSTGDKIRHHFEPSMPMAKLTYLSETTCSTGIIWLAGMTLEILAQVGKSKKAKNYKFVAACQLAV